MKKNKNGQCPNVERVNSKVDSIAVPAFAVWLNTKQGALSTQKGLPLYDIYLIVNLII